MQWPNLIVSAMWILAYDWSFELYSGYLFRPWRLLMVVYTSPGIIAALWILNFKESPRFLVMKNRLDKAADVLKWINKVNRGNANFDNLVIDKQEIDPQEQSGNALDTKNK